MSVAAPNNDWPITAFDPGWEDFMVNPHLAFGKGIHFCLGAALARLEGKIAFKALLELNGLELEGDRPQWAPVTTFRRLITLPVRFQPVKGDGGQ